MKISRFQIHFYNTGIRTILVTGLNGDGDEITETVTLKGIFYKFPKINPRLRYWRQTGFVSLNFLNYKLRVAW